MFAPRIRLCTLFWMWFCWNSVECADSTEEPKIRPEVRAENRIEVAFEDEPKNLTCFVDNAINNTMWLHWFKRRHSGLEWILIDGYETHYEITSNFTDNILSSTLHFVYIDDEDLGYEYLCALQHFTFLADIVAFSDYQDHVKIMLWSPKNDPLTLTYREDKTPPGYDSIWYCSAVASKRPTRIVWKNSKGVEIRDSSGWRITSDVFGEYGMNSTLKIAATDAGSGTNRSSEVYSCKAMFKNVEWWYFAKFVILFTCIGIVCALLWKQKISQRCIFLGYVGL